tara:strand:+ start:336 stop:1151 length:816 start_codon:yes stop_codon:yes gene_type:complete
MSFSKNLNNLRIGIAVSTYTEEKTDSKRYEIIEKSLQSLDNIIKTTKIKTYVVIVVDGPVPQKHINLLKKYNFEIHLKQENGGVARAKNTSIRLLLEKNIDIGFLADDDVLYKEGCLYKYCDVILKGKIHHIGFCQMHPLVHPKNEWKKFGYVKTNINGQEIMKHGGGGVGCWLSFTPELIKKIGYFKVMRGKYGYEHINFTHRCICQKMIPHGCDIINPLNFMDHIGFEPIGYNKFKKSHSIGEKKRVNENKKNINEWKKDLDKYVNLIE